MKTEDPGDDWCAYWAIFWYGAGTEILIWRFDHECICDCPDNQDRHVIIECPNRNPLSIWVRAGEWNPLRNFCSTMSR